MDELNSCNTDKAYAAKNAIGTEVPARLQSYAYTRIVDLDEVQLVTPMRRLHSSSTGSCANFAAEFSWIVSNS